MADNDEVLDEFQKQYITPEHYVILEIDIDGCLESEPCQHYCKIKCDDGTIKDVIIDAEDMLEHYEDWKKKYPKLKEHLLE